MSLLLAKAALAVILAVVPPPTSPPPTSACSAFTCNGIGGTVAVGGASHGSSGGGDASGTGGSGAGQPVVVGPQPVVVVHHCGPRVLSGLVRPTADAACTFVASSCSLAPGKVSAPGTESIETVTTQPDGTKTVIIDCEVPVGGAAPQVTAADIEQWVVRQLPVGTVGTPDARALVNSKAVLWLDVPVHKEWGPLTVVQAGVRIRATLTSVHWNFGDGVSDIAPDAGRVYDPIAPCDAQCPSYYGHVYTARTGAVSVTAQAYWKAEFSVNGGVFQPIPAAVPADQSPPVTVTVVQARSQLIDGG